MLKTMIKGAVQRYRRGITIVGIMIALQAMLALAPAYITMFLVDNAIPGRRILSVLGGVAALTLVTLASLLTNLIQAKETARITQYVMRDLRIRALDAINRAPLHLFMRRQSGELVNRASNDIDALEQVIAGTATSVATNGLTLAFTVAAMLSLDWRLSLIALIGLPALLIPTSIIGPKIYSTRLRDRAIRDNIQTALSENLSLPGAVIMRLFNRQTHELERMSSLSAQLAAREMEMSSYSRQIASIVTIAATFSTALVWLAGAELLLNDKVTLGALLALTTLVARMYAPASQLVGVRAQLESSMAVVDRTYRFFMELETEHAHPNESQQKSTDALKGDVVFENVSWGSGDRAILQDVSFRIEQGSFVAIVGPSGSGKTSIANLLVKLTEPRQGSITLNGIDLSDVEPSSVRQSIRLATQDAFVVQGTIADNLRYAKASASADELHEVCEAVRLLPLIESLPAGLDTDVGRQVNLSGGQKQLLSLARVLLADPDILILDEISSALDPETERTVIDGLLRRRTNRTTIMIAHRINTIANADMIIVVDQGRIVQVGDHEELVTQHGLYSRLIAAQRQRVKEAIY